jgi:type VI secretion system secreted protein Hcp
MTIYMQIEGLSGDVTELGHNNWIEIDSFSFGCSRNVASSCPGHTSDRETSLASFSEIVVTKSMDKTSPNLVALAWIGTAKTVRIDFTGSGETSSVYASYILRHVLVSSYNVCAESNGIPREKLSLNFDKIDFIFTPYKQDGSAESPIPISYDLSEASCH